MADKFDATQETVQAGGTLTVKVEDPSRAGQQVTIEIDNGLSGTSSVDVQLDANGNGQNTWPVPSTGWAVVNLNLAGSDERTVQVTTPP